MKDRLKDEKTVYGFLEILKCFVKNAVDCLCKTGYDVIRKIIGYHVELLEQTWLTWYRKGELDHVYTGDHRK